MPANASSHPDLGASAKPANPKQEPRSGLHVADLEGEADGLLGHAGFVDA